MSILNSFKDNLTVKLFPGSGDYSCLFIFLTKKGNCGGKLFFAYSACTAENNCSGVFYLVVVELAKVLHIDLALGSICYGYCAAKLDFVCTNALNCLYNVRKLTYARGLDKDSVGRKVVYYLSESFAKVTYKAATDATAVHFGDFDPGFLKKSAVNADFSEFVFNKHYFFACVSLGKQLFDERSLSRTEKA